MGAATFALPALAAPPTLLVSGRLRQGGFAIGRTSPRAPVTLDGQPVTMASSAGWFFIGFDRDAPASSEIRVETPEGPALHRLEIIPGDFDVQRISGLPKDQVLSLIHI